MDYLLKDVTYKNNLVGVGHRYGHVDAPGGSNIVNVNVEKAAELETLNIPSAGAIVYKDESGKRIYDLADSTDKLTVMANFANFTTNVQNVRVVAELYDINNEVVATAAPAIAPLPGYTTVEEYYVGEVWKFTNKLVAYIKTNVDSSFNPVTNTAVEHVITACVPYYTQTKDYVENTLNNDSDIKVFAEWKPTEVSPPPNNWFVGLKEEPYLPLSEQRSFEFNLTRPVEPGDYVKVSVYGGVSGNELLRPADILECSLESGDKPEFTVMALKMTKGSDGKYTANANVKNTFNAAKNVSFIVAIYDVTKLVDVQVILKTIAAGYDDVYSFEYMPAITLQPTYTVKVMAWDSNQVPFCGAFMSLVEVIQTI